jgi:hypothetical protein
MMKRSKRYLPLSLAISLLAVSSVAAVATDDDSNPPSMGHTQVQTIESAAAQALAVLEESRTATDALAPDLAARMDTHAPFGMNPDLSRLAIGNVTNSVYVIPANDHVCVSLTMGDGADLSCPSTEDVAAGNAGPTTVNIGTGIAIYGIVPDGVESVSIQADGPLIGVGTERNAYYTVVPPATPLRSASYDGPSGPVEFDIHDPSAVFEE